MNIAYKKIARTYLYVDVRIVSKPHLNFSTHLLHPARNLLSMNQYPNFEGTQFGKPENTIETESFKNAFNLCTSYFCIEIYTSTEFY